MSKTWWKVVAALTILSSLAPPASAQYASQRVASGLTRPTYVTSLPGDASRVFILEQPGRIRILKNGSLLTRPFLDITSIVNSSGDEQGLLGLAFDPAYSTNGRFYVYFIGGTGAGNSQIRRYVVSTDPDSSDPATSARVFQLAQPFTNHNGGTILFGPDDYLYFGLGDGGSAGDPGNRAQSGGILLGKMLRLDLNGDDFPADANNNYTIPPTNPFIADPNVRDEIWAIGVRNPYRFSFDRATSDLYIADVGQGDVEEVDFEPAGFAGGRNYGWRLMEGDQCFNPMTGCDDGDPVLTYPVHTYLHFPPEGGFNCSITGGVVYRGSALPQLQGHYFFGDYCSNLIWTIKMVGGVATELTERNSQITSLDGFTIQDIVAIGEDDSGEIYIADRGNAVAGQGEVFKLVKDPAYTGVPQVATGGPAGLLALSRVAPNPFRGSTSFDLTIARSGEVEVGIYDAAGRIVKRLHSGALDEGRHAFTWDGATARGEDAVAGVYFVRATGLGASSTERVALLR